MSTKPRILILFSLIGRLSIALMCLEKSTGSVSSSGVSSNASTGPDLLKCEFRNRESVSGERGMLCLVGEIEQKYCVASAANRDEMPPGADF